MGNIQLDYLSPPRGSFSLCLKSLGWAKEESICGREMLTRKHQSETGWEWTVGEQWRQPLAACLARLATAWVTTARERLTPSTLLQTLQQAPLCSSPPSLNSFSSLKLLLNLLRHPVSTHPYILTALEFSHRFTCTHFTAKAMTLSSCKACHLLHFGPDVTCQLPSGEKPQEYS